MVNLTINGVETTMELDTGASTAIEHTTNSVISSKTHPHSQGGGGGGGGFEWV